MRNPAPNVDALSGCLMRSHNVETEFILLIMACSRGMGIHAQLVWDRGEPTTLDILIDLSDV
jgi:citrate synthase